VAGQYRALLIGNSTYPADEHSLQTLKGPVKDIAVLNRALVDADTGLFADADVTLLPEVTSTRAIRALGRFFGTAGRDDVLLFYFSGHGQLDQLGRLHLCMQDTELTDLLATAVSSARINEFADASRARNVVIVLDCCYSGAFRGGELGNAVAGPGRYVLTSCRSTQLANDATAENSTSHFTQHLVDGLLGAAIDHDADGYVTFSDLYAYVDRRLRATGKQIPQQRVEGDGDLVLAKRPAPVPAPVQEQVAASFSGPAASGPAAEASDAGAVSAGQPTGGMSGRLRLGLLLAAIAVAAAVAGGTTAGVLLSSGGENNGGGNNGGGGNQAASTTYTSPKTYTFTGPWQVAIQDIGVSGQPPASGCSLWIIDAKSDAVVRHVADGLYGMSSFQVPNTGTFHWRVNSQNCLVTPSRGTTATLPFDFQQNERGDTPVFAVSTANVTVTVHDWYGSTSCDFDLDDATDGVALDSKTAYTTAGRNPVTLRTYGRKHVYLEVVGCLSVQVSAGP
jgi:Caspase domain